MFLQDFFIFKLHIPKKFYILLQEVSFLNYIKYYFIGINIITFTMFYIDKKRAQRRQWRIPEAWLFGLSAVGGALGGILSMNIIKHKTKKPSFKLFMPILLVVNFLIAYFISMYI